MYSLLIALFVYINVHLNFAKTVNIEVTLNQKEVSKLFDAGELWSVNYVNASSELVSANVVVTQDKYELLLSKKLPSTITNIKMIYDNVEQVLKQEKAKLDNRTRWTSDQSRQIFFEQYRDWLEYEAFILEFMLEFGENGAGIASIENIGSTVQGRQIPMITLSTGAGDGNKPGFYIMAELHAREWLANAATMYIMNEIAEEYVSGDSDATEILENINIYFVPTVNIDGYIYSWVTDRNWRKNRRANAGGSFGVDLNRNYASPDFCGIGASSNPTSNTYCGTGPASEPETVATYNVINDESLNLKAGWDMHTVGPLLLWPYAYTFGAAPNKDELETYGAELEQVIRDVNGVTYRSQQAAELYPCAGTAVDYYYIYGGIEDYPITFEGRGPGFNPPASNIIPSGEEIYAGMVMTAKKLY